MTNARAEEFFASSSFTDVITTDFNKYDRDGSGFIEVGELRNALQEANDELAKIDPTA